MAQARCRFATDRRTGWKSLSSGALWLLPLLTMGQALGRDPGRGPPSDTGPPPAPTPDSRGPAPSATLSQPPASADAENWHQNLVRERPVEVRLKAAQKDLLTGHATEALQNLQAILDGDDDVFVRLESLAVPLGSRQLAEQLLAHAPSQVKQAYETLHGSEARALLAQARTASNPQGLAQVARRFFHTSAGREATVLLAHHWHNHGNIPLAAACWRRLLDDSLHARRLSPVQRLAAASVLNADGQHQLATEITARLTGARPEIAGQPVEPQAWLAAYRLPEGAGHCPTYVCGAADRNGSAHGTGPAPGTALWTRTLAGEASGHIAALATAWETYQIQNGSPIGAAHFPVMCGGQLVFRDYEGLRSVDPETGATHWYHPTVAALSREIPNKGAIPAEGNPDPNNTLKDLVGNCRLGMLAADRARVFYIDQFEGDVTVVTASTKPASEGPATVRRQCNLLIALDVADAAARKIPTVTWQAGGKPPAEGEAPAGPLAGHYFVGPPLVLADRLFAVSEFRQQLHVTCLDASTGAIEWIRAVCSVPQPIHADFHRYWLVCSPSYSEGVLVVPTQAGVLVGLDAVTGRLIWAASHDDAEPQHRQQMSAWPYSTRRRYSHPGYTNLPVICRGRVIYLPAHSESIHCLDLATGVPLWRVPREDLEASSACEYVAAVAGDVVFIAGRRRSRGLDLATGAERYTLRLASAPAGRGARIGGDYFLPLDDGRIVGIDLAMGRQAAVALDLDRASLGNLVVAGDLVISMGRSALAARRQAHAELARMQPAPVHPQDALPHALAAARLDAALGHLDAAQRRLETLGTIPADAPLAGPIASFEQWLGHARLAHRLPDTEVRLARWSTFTEIPIANLNRDQFGSGAAREGSGDLTRLREYARVVALKVPAPLASPPDDPSLFVAPAARLAALLRPGAAGTTPSEIDETLAADVARALESHDFARALRSADLAGYAAAPRLLLPIVDLLLARGRLHEAELLVLAARKAADAGLAARGARLLAETLSAAGLHHDAGQVLAELAETHAHRDTGDGQAGSEYLARVRRDRPMWKEYLRGMPPLWSGTGATITEERKANDSLHAIYNGNGIHPLTVPRSLPFDLFDKRPGAAGNLLLVDRHTGVELPETIQLPGRYSYPVSSLPGHVQHSFVGRFLPVGAAGAVHGLSLLERRIVWTTDLPGLAGIRELVRIGPAGPRFCACQYRQHLVVLDPVDGQIRWRRDDLEPMSGLMGDQYLGIIGDEQVLVVFAGQGTSYTIYNTATGDELRRGRLDVQARHARRAFGRRLFHFTSPETRRVRVWDPLTDTFVWDEPADQFAEASLLDGVVPGTKVFSFVRDVDEAAFVMRNGMVRVVDLPRGQTLFDAPLEPGLVENLGFIRAFRDHERYYFNLQRTGAAQRGQAAPTHMISDALLPAVHVEGDLCAIDRHTHETQWTRGLSRRSILHLPDYPLPVLVTLYRVRKGDQPTLAVEIIDARTGTPRALRDDLYSDRLLQALYEREPGQITLRGAKTEIRLEFPTDLARLNAGDRRR